MSVIFDALLSTLGWDGSKRRRRERETMWQAHSFPAAKRSDRYQSWVIGTGTVAPHRLTFTQQGGAVSAMEIADAELGGAGPAMTGPSVLLMSTTRSAEPYVLAVPKEYSERILAVLLGTE
jgi:hypothetical protein